LTRCGELTAAVLATLHNVRFYLDFMADLRQAIELGALTDMANIARRTTGGDPPEGPDVRVLTVSSDPPEQQRSS
jgi:queuine/archaeosine tRNA-ribosyltransferase